MSIKSAGRFGCDVQYYALCLLDFPSSFCPVTEWMIEKHFLPEKAKLIYYFQRLFTLTLIYVYLREEY